MLRDPYLRVVLEEMCRRVGTRFEDVDFSDEKWFTKHSWTAEEDKRFQKWLADYLYRNTEARKELTACPRDKKRLREFAEWFSHDYGWSLKGGADGTVRDNS